MIWARIVKLAQFPHTHNLLKTLAAVFVLTMTVCAQLASAQWVPLNPVREVVAEPSGVLFTLQTGYLRFQIDSDAIVHVVYSMDKELPPRQDFLLLKKTWPKIDFSLHTEDAKVVSVTTSLLKIEVTRADSSISQFFIV